MMTYVTNLTPKSFVTKRQSLRASSIMKQTLTDQKQSVFDKNARKASFDVRDKAQPF